MATLTPLLAQPPPPPVAMPPLVLPRPSTRQREERASWRRQQDEAILDVARQRWRAVDEFEAAWRDKALQDLKFRAGEQWDPLIKQARLGGPNPRVVLTINQLPKFIHQVTNDERQNRPAIEVCGVDRQADQDTAQAWRGLIRHIEYDSDADVAYDTGFDCAVTYGKGFWRVLTDYETPWAFAQKLVIERILNPFAVYLDPAGRRDPDYHRMQYGFVVERQSKDVLCERYEITAQQWQQWGGKGDSWVMRDEALVADYYSIEEQRILLCQLPDGSVRYAPMVPSLETGEEDEDEAWAQEERLQVLQLRLMARGVQPLRQGEEEVLLHPDLRKRESTVPLVWWYKICGHAILERRPWVGQYIPIIPVLGEELEINGTMDYRGLVRDAIDAQRMFNYARSMAADTVALAPKAPYLGVVGQFAGHETKWGTANTTNWAYLEYNAVDVNGAPAPPPQRHVQEPAIQAITLFAVQASNDLNATIGIYPPALGERSNETSGIAIRNRQQQSQQGAAHFPINLTRALRQTGRILLDAGPSVYHEPERVVRIVKPDASQAMVMLHPQGQQAVGPQGLPPGIEGMYNLSAGTYDVIVKAGPNYETKRAETAATLTELASVVPQIPQVMPDILVGTQDFAEVDEAVRRLKKTLPPGLLDEQQTKPEDQVVVLTHKLQQLQQETQQLNAHAHQVEQALQQVQRENQRLMLQQQSREGELAVKRESERDQMTIELRTLDLEAEKLALERAKFAADQTQTQGEMQQVQGQLADLQAQMRALLTLERREQAGEAEV